MEHVGPITSSGTRPDDLIDLLGRRGPFATLWVATPLEFGSRDPLVPALTTMSGALLAEGVPAEIADAIAATVEAHRHDGAGLVVVADGDGVLLVEPLPVPPRAELVRWAALPSLAPVLEHRQAQVPYVVALLDRTGADLFAGVPEHQVIDTVVDGKDHPLTKSAPGGWSQSRYQQRAENTWEQNAGDVAREMVRLVERTAARLVLIGGDVRARQLVEAALPQSTRALLRAVPGGRARDGSDEERAADIRRLVHTAVAADTAEILHDFRDQAGQDRAVEGRAATIDALRQARADVLLVHDDPGDTDSVWTGPSAEHLAFDRSVLEAMGVEDPREARATDAIIHTALASGASVRAIPGSTPLADGIGAILRW